MNIQVKNSALYFRVQSEREQILVSLIDEIIGTIICDSKFNLMRALI